MFAIFGTRNFGKVDHVPGLFYLSTQFFHINFVPLIPLGTHLVIDGSEQGNGFRGVKIGLSGKSVLFSYLRVFFMLGGIIAMVLGFAAMSHNNPMGGAVFIAAGIAGLVLFFLTYRLSRPSPQRAIRLAQQAGIKPEIVAQFFVGANLLPEAESDDRNNHR